MAHGEFLDVSVFNIHTLHYLLVRSIRHWFVFPCNKYIKDIKALNLQIWEDAVQNDPCNQNITNY